MKPAKQMTTPTFRSYVRPDGGYGWFIVFAAFLCYVCVAGTAKTNGLFFIYFMTYYGASNSAVSTVTFVQKISETVTALLWSFLAERYGSRIIVLCGAVTVTTGTLLSAFAPNIFFLTITYGIICGMAFSMINYPAVQMLPRYFEKKLIIGSALIFCGTPVGSLTVPYLLSKAVEVYGLGGAFFIVSGILLHVFIAGALLRPLYFEEFAEKTDYEGIEVDTSAVTPIKITITDGEQTKSPEIDFAKSSSLATIPSVTLLNLGNQSDKAISSSDNVRRHRSVPVGLRSRRMASQVSKASTKTTFSTAEAIENMAVSFAIMDNMSMGSTQNIAAIGRQLSFPECKRSCSTSVKNVEMDQLKSGDPAVIVSQRHSSSYSVGDSEMSEFHELESKSIFRTLVDKYRHIVTNKLFLLLTFSNFLHAFGYSIWNIFQLAYIKDLGYDDSFRQIFLISATSFAELASRLSLGFVISRNWMKVYRWNQLACTLMAIAFCTYPFMRWYPVLVAYNCFVSAVFSINVVTSMPNMKEFLGIDLAALGQGLMVVPVGFGIVSVQIGGIIRDMTGSFVPAYYMAAVAFILSVLNFQVLGFLSDYQHLPFWSYCFFSKKDSAGKSCQKDGVECSEDYSSSCATSNSNLTDISDNSRVSMKRVLSRETSVQDFSYNDPQKVNSEVINILRRTQQINEES